MTRVLISALALVLTVPAASCSPINPSMKISYEPPVLISPLEGQVMDNGCTSQANALIWDFEWSEIAGSLGYNLQVRSKGSVFPEIYKEDVFEPKFRYEQQVYTPILEWEWRVRARLSGDLFGEPLWTDLSETRTFKVEPVNTDCK